IKPKESTLQLVYDVLRRCPFFNAFLVTMDVPEIYMQEFWATATVYYHSIRFKVDTKKHIINLESFRDILHICPRVPGQPFADPSFEEEILAFIHFLGHSAAIKMLTDGLYHKRNIDYAYLMWEDFVYQVEHKNQKKSNEMCYPRFTKAIIHHFMSKDPSIPRRNKVKWHYVWNDFMFSMIKLVSRHQNAQQFGAMLPIELMNDEIRNSKAYKEYYAITTGEAAPKPKASARRTRSSSDTSKTPLTAAASLRLKASAKGKQTAKASKAKSLFVLSEVAMIEAQQLKLVTKRSMQQTHISQPSGSCADEGTGSKPGVPDVPTDESEEELSWNSIDDEGDDNKEGGDDEHEFDEETKEEESFDPISQSPKDSEDDGDDEEDLDLIIGEEERHDEEEEEDELYRDVNINQGRGLQGTLEVEDTHVTLTLVNPDGQQESSSVSSQFTPTSVAHLPITTPTMTSSTIATTTPTSQAPTLPTTIPTEIIQHLPSFSSLFRFDDRLRYLEEHFSKVTQTNQFAGAVFTIPGIFQHYMDQRMNEAVQVAVQLQSDWLCEEAQRENDEFLRTVDENIKKIIKEQILIEKIEGNKSIQRSDEQRNLYKALVDAYESDKIILDTYGETVTLKKRHDDDEDKDEEPSAGPDRGSKRRKEGKEPESASAPSEPATKSAGRLPLRLKSPHTRSLKQKPPTPDRDWNKTLPAVYGSIQLWISELAKQADSRSSFNKLIDTHLDFSNFIMNRLRVDTLTPKLLVGPTYDLTKRSCKSLIELKYHLEEVYKAKTDQLEWVNPKGQQYPHNLLQPLPLIPDNRGHRVIPFAHFINNDLEYLRGGASSHKYTTSVTKTKAADYGYIKWIEDLFYSFVVNRESARDVYSKRRIIAVTELKIVEWHSYKHLDWITVQRDDDKLYTFKKGDYTRLRIQDIKDMLLLLVQGKLTNLTVEERFAFNVSLQMFTRSIVLQRHVEDLQLSVESYEKRLNLMKSDTYQSDLKLKEAYNAYSIPRGFIYQNKDKKNRLMLIDELHKFNDVTPSN
nr:hypothetical protein [Tanacetum cinerariifolium]